MQTILACDDNGNFLEYIPKEVGHTGEGRRHLAITVLIYNSKGEVLLQKRKHKVFDNIWDFTASTHPLHLENKDESFKEAAVRSLKDEWGIRDIRDIREIGEFNYFAKDGDYCENEYDVILIGEYDREINLNPEVGYEYKWIQKKDFLKDIETNPKNYTPWVIKGMKVLTENKFF